MDDGVEERFAQRLGRVVPAALAAQPLIDGSILRGDEGSHSVDSAFEQAGVEHLDAAARKPPRERDQGAVETCVVERLVLFAMPPTIAEQRRVTRDAALWRGSARCWTITRGRWLERADDVFEWLDVFWAGDYRVYDAIRVDGGAAAACSVRGYPALAVVDPGGDAPFVELLIAASRSRAQGDAARRARAFWRPDTGDRTPRRSHALRPCGARPSARESPDGAELLHAEVERLLQSFERPVG